MAIETPELFSNLDSNILKHLIQIKMTDYKLSQSPELIKMEHKDDIELKDCAGKRLQSKNSTDLDDHPDIRAHWSTSPSESDSDFEDNIRILLSRPGSRTETPSSYTTLGPQSSPAPTYRLLQTLPTGLYPQTFSDGTALPDSVARNIDIIWFWEQVIALHCSPEELAEVEAFDNYIWMESALRDETHPNLKRSLEAGIKATGFRNATNRSVVVDEYCGYLEALGLLAAFANVHGYADEPAAKPSPTQSNRSESTNSSSSTSSTSKNSNLFASAWEDSLDKPANFMDSLRQAHGIKGQQKRPQAPRKISSFESLLRFFNGDSLDRENHADSSENLGYAQGLRIPGIIRTNFTSDRSADEKIRRCLLPD